MKKSLVIVPLAGSLAFGAAVYAQQSGGYGPMGHGPGMMGHGMGPGMMRGDPYGHYGYPCGGHGMMGHGHGMMGHGMMGGPGAAPPQAQLTEESAKTLAQQYADKYLKGYTVERVLPFTGMGGMTMYQAELNGPKDEARTLHINPWGNVMPFGGPWRRG